MQFYIIPVRTEIIFSTCAQLEDYIMERLSIIIAIVIVTDINDFVRLLMPLRIT
jgi:hypothetical protein